MLLFWVAEGVFNGRATRAFSLVQFMREGFPTYWSLSPTFCAVIILFLMTATGVIQIELFKRTAKHKCIHLNVHPVSWQPLAFFHAFSPILFSFQSFFTRLSLFESIIINNNLQMVHRNCPSPAGSTDSSGFPVKDSDAIKLFVGQVRKLPQFVASCAFLNSKMS